MNHDEKADYMREYYQKHCARLLAYQEQYRKENGDSHRQYRESAAGKAAQRRHAERYGNHKKTRELIGVKGAK